MLDAGTRGWAYDAHGPKPHQTRQCPGPRENRGTAVQQRVVDQLQPLVLPQPSQT